ncbi:nuclease-related domain-containing protein [Paenibacillus sp. BSR1-1]|uniref:nuclease-related domain-containing protein n=1 Tax=Paenibacillus sp. BSR1-1 TaxID=3020845 RepID=UPI0025AFABB9|nr:nuclease-related domain-containing protein [Paenibacillus sp. BSR1-1]MDN3019870.1 nuclease-related domain-containing protein [Paenibacillus sp. BSR1-1]
MVKKPLTKTAELIALGILNTRMDLPLDAKNKYLSLKKGYDGEMKFNSLTEMLGCECLISNGLLLEVNNTKFQIDSLVISQPKIFMNEIKNLEGEYYYENGRFYYINGSERKNPLIQLQRSSSLLRQLLQSLGLYMPIEPWVVHINPEFTLYQASRHDPIILPTKVNSYMRKLDMLPSKVNGKHVKLADKLMSLHIKEPPYPRLPPYQYNWMRKGIICALCHSFSIFVCGQKCVCGGCGHEELVEAAVLRCVEELRLLFPEMKITTSAVLDWCQVFESRKRISRILRKNFNIIGDRRWVLYE